MERADLSAIFDRVRSDPATVTADELAAAVRPELEQLALRHVYDRALIDDVVQEALLEVMSSHAALRDPSAARSWLRLLVRKHTDRVTRSRRPAAPLEVVAASRAESADEPDRVAERLDDVAMIRRALEVASDADALLLRLRYLGEWTDAELSELVGVAAGTIRKRLHAARRRMRTALDATSTAPRPARSRPTGSPTGSRPTRPKERHPMTDLDSLLGRVVAPADVPEQPPVTLTPTGERLETGLKVLDAVLPVERGGIVDLLGPEGLGELVLVGEIAAHIGAVVIAAGEHSALPPLVTEVDEPLDAIVIAGPPAQAAAAADRAARGFAAAGRDVLVVADAATWAAAPPSTGTTDSATRAGSVTAFRFAPHPRGGEPHAALADAGATLVYSTQAFVEQLHPAIDVVASRSRLIDEGVLDDVTVGAARAARDLLVRAGEIRSFLAQPLVLGASYTGIPGVQVPARQATERLAELVR